MDFSSPVTWIFLGALFSALAAIFAAVAGWRTLREQDQQIATVRAWLTGGDSIVYYEPLRLPNRLAFFIRHSGAQPSYDVVVRVHERRHGREALVEGPFLVGTVSGGSGFDWISPKSLRFFPDPPSAKEPAREFRIELQARNGVIVQHLKLSVVGGRWETSSRAISGGAFDRGVELPTFAEAQHQETKRQ